MCVNHFRWRNTRRADGEAIHKTWTNCNTTIIHRGLRGGATNHVAPCTSSLKKCACERGAIVAPLWRNCGAIVAHVRSMVCSPPLRPLWIMLDSRLVQEHARGSNFALEAQILGNLKTNVNEKHICFQIYTYQRSALVAEFITILI